MAIGSRIVSCYSGPADPVSFGMNYEVPGERTHKLQHSEKSRHLFTLYQKVRDARENKEPLQNMTEVWDELKHIILMTGCVPSKSLNYSTSRKMIRFTKKSNNFLIQKNQKVIPSGS